MKISRILRISPPTVSRALTQLTKLGFIVKTENEYSITDKGSDLLKKPKYQTDYYEKLREYIEQLKTNPESKGWTTDQIDLGGLTPAQSEVLYLFEEDDHITNAEIARILRRASGTTHTDLDFLVGKKLLKKNLDGEYSITPSGLDLTSKNVSRNGRCKWLQIHVKSLKSKPDRTGLWATSVAGLTSLGLLKSNSAHAVTSAGIISTPSSISTVTATSTVVAPTITPISVLTSKTVLASMLITLLSAGSLGGIYVAEPQVFADTISLNSIAKITNTSGFTNTSTTNLPNVDSNTDNANTGFSSNNRHITSSDTSNISSDVSVEQATKVEQATPTQESQTTGSGGGSNHSAGTLPSSNSTLSNASFDTPRGISTDIQGNIYVADAGNSRIQKFDPDGNFLLSFGEKGSGDGQLESPRGIAIDSKNNIYVTDSENSRIQKFDPDGNFLLSFGEIDFGIEQLRSLPTIAINNKDNVLVLDYTIGHVQKYTSDGNFLLSFGEKGSGDGQFSYPEGIAIDSKNNIYVTDSENSRIQKFDPDGNFLLSFGEKGSGDGQFSYPEGITVDGKNNIYVADSKTHRIQLFQQIDSNSECPDDTDKIIDGVCFVKSFDDLGTNEKDPPGWISIDRKGDILVTIPGANKVITVDFETAIATFTLKFDEILCNTDSMINDPISVPPEVRAALPISELLPRANDLTFDAQQYKQGLLLYYITSQIQPTNVNVWNGIGYTQTQICSNDSAAIAYTQALSIDPTNINAKIGLADFTINQVVGDNTLILKLDDVQLQLQSVLDLDPGNTNALNALGLIETLRDNYNSAINYYEQSLKIDDKKTTTLNGLAFAYLRSDNLDESIPTYLKVTSIDSTNSDALIGLITAYTQQGFQGSAKQFIDQLDESNNIVADKLIEQGNWLQQNGQTKEAQRLFDAANKLK